MATASCVVSFPQHEPRRAVLQVKVNALTADSGTHSGCHRRGRHLNRRGPAAEAQHPMSLECWLAPRPVDRPVTTAAGAARHRCCICIVQERETAGAARTTARRPGVNGGHRKAWPCQQKPYPSLVLVSSVPREPRDAALNVWIGVVGAHTNRNRCGVIC